MVMESAMTTEIVTAIAMVMATGEGDDDKGRVASSCAGNVQCYGRGNTLPPPPWTQKKVHSPALRHGGDIAKSVSSLSGGGFLTAHHGLFLLLIFYNYCSVY